MENPEIQNNIPQHIAIIMDGNGRWAQKRGLPRLAGHRAGTENIRRIVEGCDEMGVKYLTIYAFSTENWERPKAEVRGLMRILGQSIGRETALLNKKGVRIRHIGRLEKVPQSLQKAIQKSAETTKGNSRLFLNVAFNYGGRNEITDAIRKIIESGVKAEDIDENLISNNLYTAGIPDPDLIIRTAGEWRLSNFLIWQSAYSEYWSTPVPWPDFDKEELKKAVAEYSRRNRKFGRLEES